MTLVSDRRVDVRSLSMKRPGAFLMIVTAVVMLTACGKEEDPIAIPYKPDDAPTAKPSATVPPPPPATKPEPKRAPKKVRVVVAGIDGCCGALASRRSKAQSEGDRAMLTQAIGICSRQSSLLKKKGKTTRNKALAQVRAALLGIAPKACY